MKELLRKKALEIYKPPFEFRRGYIFDSEGNMFSDDGGSGDRIARIRGWGRLLYFKDVSPEDLQDEIGAMFAEALTKYWSEYEKST